MQLSVAAVAVEMIPGESIRLHLELSPKVPVAVWNNGAEPLRGWIHEEQGGTPQSRL